VAAFASSPEVTLQQFWIDSLCCFATQEAKASTATARINGIFVSATSSIKMKL
jgi:hypothetical protein